MWREGGQVAGRNAEEVAARLVLGQESSGEGDEEGLVEAEEEEEEMKMGLVGRTGAAGSSLSPCGLLVTDSSRNVGHLCANHAGVLRERGGTLGSVVAHTAVALGGEVCPATTGPGEACPAGLRPGMTSLSASSVGGSRFTWTAASLLSTDVAAPPPLAV